MGSFQALKEAWTDGADKFFAIMVHAEFHDFCYTHGSAIRIEPRDLENAVDISALHNKAAVPGLQRIEDYGIAGMGCPLVGIERVSPIEMQFRSVIANAR